MGSQPDQQVVSPDDPYWSQEGLFEKVDALISNRQSFPSFPIFSNAHPSPAVFTGEQSSQPAFLSNSDSSVPNPTVTPPFKFSSDNRNNRKIWKAKRKSARLVLGDGVGLEDLCKMSTCALVGRISYKSLNPPPLEDWIVKSWLPLLGYSPTVQYLKKGAQRATTIAEGLHNSVRWWRIVGSAAWDYIVNYAWRESFSRPSQYAQVLFHFNEILSAFEELMQARSEMEKLQWISQNYQRVLRISKSLLQKLLAIFSQSGPLRESIMAIQKEISDGELIRDCLQLGAADVKGLLQVVRDMIISLLAAPSSRQGSSHAEL